MSRRAFASILVLLTLTNSLSVNAVNLGDATDKYSDTTVTKEQQSITSNKSTVTTNTGNYLEATVAPSETKSSNPDTSSTGNNIMLVKDIDAHRLLEGTVIRSINNKCSSDLYIPSIKDLPWLTSKIIKDLNFGAVYDGQWDFDTVQSNSGVIDSTRVQGKEYAVNTRATKILGLDALTVDESYSVSKGYASTTLKTSSNVTLKDGITIAYKALSDNYYKIQAYPTSNGTASIPVAKTPFVTAVGANNIDVNSSRYYTDIWVSRTCPDIYYNQAIIDGITAYKKDETEADNNLTLAQFCVIVAKLLDLNGEEVITDQETKQLLSVYQRSIPAYTTSIEQDAIKYLLARGIVDGSEKFKDTMTADTALTILMRAKDKSSRLTFKHLSISYDQSLLDKGFTGIDLNTNSNNISNSVQVTNKSEVAKYYDYYIRVTPATTFKDTNGKEVTAVYVSDHRISSGDEGGKRIEGSDYIGIVNGYYHFKIPIDSTPSTFMTDKYKNPLYTITTRSSDNVPKMYFVEEGGGVYDDFSMLSSNGKEYTVCKRTPFTSTDDPLLVDRERKQNSQLAMKDTDEVKLTSNTYTAKIQIRNVSNTFWGGTKISDINGRDEGTAQDISGAKVYLTSTNMLVVNFTDEKDPWGAIAKKLTSNIMDGEDSSECYPSYMLSSEATPILLVSYKWLSTRTNLPNRITDAPVPLKGSSQEDKKYEIETENGPIQVDLKNKTFATGALYTELGSADKSPLLFQTDNKDWYIDYRIIMGSTAGFIVFDNQDSTKSLCPTDVHDQSVNAPISRTVKSLTGSEAETLSVNALFKQDDNSKMLLEGPYSKSNFMLYKLNRQGLKGDYLLVFKPKGEDIADNATAEVSKKLADIFKIKLGSNYYCSIYNLDNTVQEESNVIHSLSSSVSYEPGYGYVYKVPSVNSFDINKYYNPTADTNCPLPLVSYNGNIYDVNTNHVQGFTSDRVPASLLTEEFKTLTDNNDLTYSKGFQSASNKLVFSQNSQMVPAPIGLTACYKDEYDKTAKDLYSTNDINLRAVGSIGGKLQEESTSANNYDFILNDGAYNYKIKSSDLFYLAGGNSSLSGSKGIYVYKDPDGIGITSVADLNNALSASLLMGNGKNIFDWDMFSLIEALRQAEDVMTVCYIVLLEIVPRIFLYIFLLLGVLSLVSDMSLVQVFCTKVIDPFSILSFGMLDVYTIDKRRIWITSFFAAVLLALLNVQSFTNILAWFVRAVIGIINR